MNCNTCVYCGDLFWCRDEETDICVTCIEEPVQRANTDRAVEQALRYLVECRKKGK